MKKSIRNLVITLALLCTLASGQNVRFDGVVSSHYGQPAGGAKIAVCSQPASSTIYPCPSIVSLCASLTDAACTSPNPVTADGLGNYHFYILAGSTPYTVQFYGSGLTPYFMPDQTFGAGGGGGGGTAQQYLNSSNGTTCNGLAKVDQAAGASSLGRATSTSGGEVVLLGVVLSGCGTSGSATIAFAGQLPVIFDSASANVGDAVGVSMTVPGAAIDLGSSNPTSGAAIIGTITLSPSGAQPSACTVAPGCYVQLNLGGGGGGGQGGSPNAVVTNPATNATNSIQPTVSTVQGLTVEAPSSAGGTLPILQANDNTGAQALAVLQNGTVKLGKSGAAPSVGSDTAANTDLDGELTMSSNTATYTFSGTYSSHPTCIASNETATAANSGIKVTYTGVVSVTFTTTGASDVISYHCLFRN